MALPVFGQNRVGDIEFFGYTGIKVNLSQIRKALPVHVGDKITISPKTKQGISASILHATGIKTTNVALIGSVPNEWTIFIGLPGPKLAKLSYYPAPKEDARFSVKVVDLNRQLESAMDAAVQKGGTASEEDDSHGYTLTKYPPARALQLQLRKYALGHEDEILKVLRDSSDPTQRSIAARALGYARESPKQIAALIYATRDPNSGVRNHATRAIGVLASSSPKVASQIPADNFITMLRSPIWTDRNKASFVLLDLTKARSPALLAHLRAKALYALVEMAKWHDVGHAAPARIILGRMAGIPEKNLWPIAFQR